MNEFIPNIEQFYNSAPILAEQVSPHYKIFKANIKRGGIKNLKTFIDIYFLSFNTENIANLAKELGNKHLNIPFKEQKIIELAQKMFVNLKIERSKEAQ